MISKPPLRRSITSPSCSGLTLDTEGVPTHQVDYKYLHDYMYSSSYKPSGRVVNTMDTMVAAETTTQHHPTGPTILLGGTGGLVHMMFGIGAFIEDHYDIENVNWKSISGSNYVVTSLCSKYSKYSTSSIWKLWSLRQADLKHRYPLIFFFKLYKMIHAHTLSILTQNQQFANYILISFLYQRKR